MAVPSVPRQPGRRPMPVITKSVEVYAPVESLWRYANDREKDPEWIKGFVQRRALNDREGEAGERYLVAYDFAGRRYELTCETVALEENRLIRSRQVRGPFQKWESTQCFEEMETGVRYTHTLDYLPPRGGLAGLLGGAKKLHEDIDRKLNGSTWKIKEFVEAVDWF